MLLTYRFGVVWLLILCRWLRQHMVWMLQYMNLMRGAAPAICCMVYRGRESSVLAAGWPDCWGGQVPASLELHSDWSPRIQGYAAVDSGCMKIEVQAGLHHTTLLSVIIHTARRVSCFSVTICCMTGASGFCLRWLHLSVEKECCFHACMCVYTLSVVACMHGIDLAVFLTRHL